jgi:hypothetical protein
MSEFRKSAHQAGVLPGQAQKMADFFAVQVKAQIEKTQAERTSHLEKELGKLKTEWGQAYEPKIIKARAALKEFGDQELTDFLGKSGLGNHPAIIKLLAKIGDSMSEDKIKGSGGHGENVLTPNEAKTRIGQIMADPKGPYFDKNHPNHKNAVEEMNKLFLMANPKA